MAKMTRRRKTIEEKVENILNIIGGAEASATSGDDEDDGRVGDEKLLNGPQMKDQAITQDDIDSILSEFD